VDGTRLLSDAGVSAREAEVLAALAGHHTNAEIAARLHISIRTVESHVSALLRKLDLADRRALAALAATLDAGAAEAPAAPTAGAAADRAVAPAGQPAPATVLPVPLTSFVGRTAEFAELSAAVAAHRLVTALGPGGVGKTRLAVAVAAEAAAGLADGVWFVDLVPVTDPTMVAAAVAGALGLGERQGSSVEQAVTARLARCTALVVLDNCEHLLDGVAVFTERLLSGCPQVKVLATSRARLMLPFERVFAVPGLSLPAEGTEGDAVALFVERASAAGPFAPSGAERRRIATICRRLDGVALAIELAAARLPTLGLDGVERGLTEHLQLLSGGRRADGRHQSLRSTLEWSHGLLAPDEQALWRRVAVFAAAFDVAAAESVAGFAADGPAGVAHLLARLADQSLLAVATGDGPGEATRYRALETIRQYGEELLLEAGELVEARGRHLRWCLDAAAGLATGTEAESWSRRFDRVADDLRAALRWAAAEPTFRQEAHRLATMLAELTFARGLPSEAQCRYEDAADLADDERAAATALTSAAGAAASRHVGDDALRLWRAAAHTHLALGDRVAAAHDLTAAATLIKRASGIITEMPPEGTADALIGEAVALATDDPGVEGAILTAQAFAHEPAPATAALAARAVELARAADDGLLESSALDLVTAVHLAAGDIEEAVATIRRRTAILEGLRPDAASGFELADGWAMATEVSLAAGDIPSARRFAARLADLPFLREEGHLATARGLPVDALAGDFPAVKRAAQRFRRGWDEAGRPVANSLVGGAIAAAFVYGLCGDDDVRAEWLAIIDALSPPERRTRTFDAGHATHDAVLFLHRGEVEAAVARLRFEPEEMRHWYSGQWRPWYSAVWAEAAVLAGRPDADERLERARPGVAPNPIARAVLARAAALHAGDPAPLPDLAAALDRAACPYQAARTLVLAGGEHRTRGQAALAALGAAPMSLPPSWGR
jgi:predicted ATPase/DNA-binding CsgD family transcriptional regulator